MSKMICISEEDYNLFCTVVFSTHDVLNELKDWGHGELRPEEEELLTNTKVAMQKIDDIDEKLKEE